MAYVTGTSADLATLRTNLLTACTDNGWTLSGEVLHKGNCYIRSQTASSHLTWLGGTGKDGSNVLTGAGPYVVRNGNFPSQNMTFPVKYEVFINTSPDEVCMVLNYATDFYQYVFFGLSDIPALPGNGVYYGASKHSDGTATSDFSITKAGSTYNGTGIAGYAFFAVTTANTQARWNAFIHHGLDGETWYRTTNTAVVAETFKASDPLIASLPSAWNSETVLLPYPVYLTRSTGNKVSLVADFKHLRHCRIDFHDPGEIITIGSDKWKIYPWYRKDATNRAGTDNGNHSGTFAFAVRYDGP